MVPKLLFKETILLRRCCLRLGGVSNSFISGEYVQKLVLIARHD